jgi:hypothetical protein
LLTVLKSARIDGRLQRSLTSNLMPGLPAAYATPPTTGARQMFTYQGAILPVAKSTTSVPTSGSAALITCVKKTVPSPIEATCAA